MENNKMVNINIKMNAEEKSYDVLNLIENRDETLLNSFIDDYHTGYICDMINKIADSNVEIYNQSLRENSVYLEEYIEEALENGFPTKNLDLIRLFMAGEFYYNSAVLNNNIDELIFNKLINILKNDKNYIIEEIKENFDNINNGDLFTVVLDNNDIQNIIKENSIDEDELIGNFEYYIRDYIIELIESREVGEIQDGSKTGKNLYVPFEIESFNKLKNFCKDGGLKPPTTDPRDEVYYITDSLKDTYKVFKI